MRNILSVDVEDYFQVSAFSDLVARSEWDSKPSRLAENLKRTLSILDEHQTKATFFVLGWVAERFPRETREIAEQGHEIASHSYDHRLVYELSREEFREDVRRSKAILEDISSTPVVGYRAPSFSITPQVGWAWEVLAEEGYLYDSSQFPVHHDRYSNPNGERFVHRKRLAGGGSTLAEFPLTTLRLLGVNIPVAGGGYLRALPLRLILRGIAKTNERNFPAVIYVHPWELDPGQPRIPVPRFRRFRHYVNLHKTERKLRRLLEQCSFAPVREFLPLYLPEEAAKPLPRGRRERCSSSTQRGFTSDQRSPSP